MTTLNLTALTTLPALHKAYTTHKALRDAHINDSIRRHTVRTEYGSMTEITAALTEELPAEIKALEADAEAYVSTVYKLRYEIQLVNQALRLEVKNTKDRLAGGWVDDYNSANKRMTALLNNLENESEKSVLAAVAAEEAVLKNILVKYALSDEKAELKKQYAAKVELNNEAVKQLNKAQKKLVKEPTHQKSKDLLDKWMPIYTRLRAELPALAAQLR